MSVGVDGELHVGSLPQKQMKILVGRLAFHEEEAYAAWELAVQGKHFDKIMAVRGKGIVECKVAQWR